MPRTGRKPKLTPAVADTILKAVALGVPVITAASYAGVSKAAILQWLQRGRGEHPDRAASPVYVDFVDRLEKSRAQDEIRRIGRIEQAAKGGTVIYEKTTRYPDGRIVTEVRHTAPEWTADAWHLERSRPDLWGRRERVDLRVTIERAAAQVAAEMGLSVDEVLAEAQLLLGPRYADGSPT
jgi:hypothetical protein